MKVIVLTFAFLLLISPALSNDKIQGRQTKKRFMNITDDQVFFPDYGVVTELYQVNGVVRNLIAPLAGYSEDTVDELKPTLYFNIHNEDGNNQGLYVLRKGTLHKINDGRESVGDYPKGNGIDKTIYIATANGIYTYDPKTEDVQKYGTLTDDVIAIDKVSGEDLIYILCADHKIYKVTIHGTKKEVVAGVDYAKDFVLDFTESIYYIGEDNKPRFLMKDSTEPHQYVELDYDVVNPVFSRPVYNAFLNEGGQNLKRHSILLVIDGMLNILTNNETFTHPGIHRVPDITAFSAEYSFINYYGAGGKIYLHNLVGLPPRKNVPKQSSKKVVSDKINVYDRDVKADFDRFKSFNFN